jgi:prokaryotic ubiquitin-like protein Pup
MDQSGRISRQPSDAVPPTPDEAVAAAPPRRDLLDGVDELLDEIDEVLEENAEEFIRGYVQKGGQ